MPALLLCLSLALAAPVLAEGPDGKAAFSIGGRVVAPGESIPLHPTKTLMMIRTAGNTETRSYDFTITPTKEAVGGNLVRQPILNVWMENCSTTRAISDTAPFHLTCTVTLKDKSRDGYVQFSNQSRGILMVDGGPVASEKSGSKKK